MPDLFTAPAPDPRRDPTELQKRLRELLSDDDFVECERLVLDLVGAGPGQAGSMTAADTHLGGSVTPRQAATVPPDRYFDALAFLRTRLSAEHYAEAAEMLVGRAALIAQDGAARRRLAAVTPEQRDAHAERFPDADRLKL